jgi:hypothetical protein
MTILSCVSIEFGQYPFCLSARLLHWSIPQQYHAKKVEATGAGDRIVVFMPRVELSDEPASKLMAQSQIKAFPKYGFTTRGLHGDCVSWRIEEAID